MDIIITNRFTWTNKTSTNRVPWTKRAGNKSLMVDLVKGSLSRLQTELGADTRQSNVGKSL